MLPAKILLKLAYKAYQSGAKDDATALTALALAADDVESIFADAVPNFVDKSHQKVSPVPGIAKPQLEEDEKDTESVTNLLENGEVDEAPGAQAPADQQGFIVKGLYDRIQEIAASLDTLGFANLALEVRNCLE